MVVAIFLVAVILAFLDSLFAKISIFQTSLFVIYQMKNGIIESFLERTLIALFVKNVE